MPAGAWEVDPARSTVGFSLRHMLVATVRGRFHDFSGEVRLDPEGRLQATGKVRVESIDTGNPVRDQRLRSAEFFDLDAHPEVSFTASRTRPLAGGEYLVAGELTINGVAGEIELIAQPQPNGDGCAHLRARGKLSRADFGMVPDSLLEAGVSDAVQLELEITAKPASS